MADNFLGPGMGGEFAPEDWFWGTPPCTRYWVTACIAVSVLVQCKTIVPLQLFFSYRSAIAKGQYWRILTTFLYFGPLSLDFCFYIYFLQRYSKLLERSLGPSPAKYAWLLLCTSLTLLASTKFHKVYFLGSALTSTLVYIWARRNPQAQLSLLGLLVFSAPYLPFVLMVFAYVIHGRIPAEEILGVLIGHVFWFLEDVYPTMYDGQRPMDPPNWWKWIFEGRNGTIQTDAGRVDADILAALRVADIG